MKKRINTGIKDVAGLEVFTGDTVTMHYFGLGIGSLEVQSKLNLRYLAKLEFIGIRKIGNDNSVLRIQTVLDTRFL